MVLLLFLVFVLGSFFVLYFGSSAYQRNILIINKTEEERLPLAYLTTKVREAESTESVDIKEIDDKKCLVIGEDIEGSEYLTLIYFEDGYVKELLTRSDHIDFRGSEKVMAASGLNMEKTGSVLVFETGERKAIVHLH